MRKAMPVIIFIIIMLTGTLMSLSNADRIDGVQPVSPPEHQVQIIKVQASAFNLYGHDANGIDYGPGYVIISDQSEIPLYNLLDIDLYGPCQAVATSDELAKDEVKLWYKSPSSVRLFGEQVGYARVLEMGDRPHKIN